MSDPVYINGHQHSWGSVKFKIDGEEFSGLSAIKFSDKLEKTKAYGTGKAHGPRARSRGKYSTELVVITFFTGSAQLLRAHLAEKSENGTSYGNVTFQMTLQFIEEGDEPVTVDFQDCEFSSNDASVEENPDPTKEDVGIDVMRILRNGLSLFDGGAAA